MKCRRTHSSITIVMGLFLVLLATLLAIPSSLRAVHEAAIPPAQHASAEIPGGAVGEYLFNEGTGNTIGDSSGYARNGENHGTVWISSPIRDANGQAGYALKFDATYVSVPSDALKHLPLTISLWASPEQNVNDHRNNIISNDRPLHSGHGIGVASNGGLWLEYEDVPGASFRNTSKALEWGKWYHLVAIYEEGRLRTYVDGQLVDDLAFRQAALDAQTTFLIGRHNFDSGLGNMVHYKGAIDAIRIYHRALTSDEISQLYQEGAPEPSGSLSSPPDNLSIGPATLPLSATVSNAGNFTVRNVEFVALYDGTWHSAGTDELRRTRVVGRLPISLGRNKSSLAFI